MIFILPTASSKSVCIDELKELSFALKP